MEILDSFFCKETICDFEVSSLMKRAWAAELEVLEILDNICNSNNIPYHLSWGSLLGAIRHNGFIPWDDDIDISLIRSDYTKLIQILDSQLPEGFVMVGMYSSDERLQNACDCHHIRLIADDEYWTFPSYLNRFHCFPYFRIGIDIFPIDYIPDSEKDRQVFFNTIREPYELASNYNDLINDEVFITRLNVIKNTYPEYFDNDNSEKLNLWLLADSLCSSIPESNSNYLLHVYEYLLNGKGIMKKDWLSSNIPHSFEMGSFPVPIGYNEILYSLYGDYSKYERFVSDHNYPFYSNQEEALKELFISSGITTPIEEFCNNWSLLNRIN